MGQCASFTRVHGPSVKSSDFETGEKAVIVLISSFPAHHTLHGHLPFASNGVGEDLLP